MNKLEEVRATQRCIKCGMGDIYTRWDPSILECGWQGRERRSGREAEFTGEHLHRHCRGCGYEWGDKPLNLAALLIHVPGECIPTPTRRSLAAALHDDGYGFLCHHNEAKDEVDCPGVEAHVGHAAAILAALAAEGN